MSKNVSKGWSQVTVQIARPAPGEGINGFVPHPEDARPIKNLNGRPTRTPRNDGKPAFFRDIHGFWRRIDTSAELDFDSLCAGVHGHIRRSILSDAEAHVFFDRMPFWVYDAGLSPESRLSKTQFEQLLSRSGPDEYLHRFLYHQDVAALLSNIQRSSAQVYQFAGTFYGLLNDAVFYHYNDQDKVDLRFSSSGDAILLHGHLESVFTRMRAILDYSVKLALEAERPPQDFSAYPKLRTAAKQYGDRKNLAMNQRENTLFVEDELIRKIASIRDRIIHDGHFDTEPRVYELFKRRRLIERFVLAPDMTEGRFDASRNRRSFFSTDNKINATLPSILDEFYSRLAATVSAVSDLYAIRRRT